jgi:hypothetical protein
VPFYISDYQPLSPSSGYGQPNQQSFGGINTGSPNYPAGRTYPITGRWRPGQSYVANYVAAQTASSRAERLNAYFAEQRAVTGLYRMQPPPQQRPPGVNPLGMNQGKFREEMEGKEYLGGYADDYVSAARVRVPQEGDFLSNRYQAYRKRPRTKEVYGQPLYREGDQAMYPGRNRLSPDDIRGWQAFFQANGFKTGPAGFWTEWESHAMKAFMTMANGTPGGGMDVNVLRQRVMADVQAGRLAPYHLADMLGVSGEGQNELAPGGGAGGGGGLDEDLTPYTETTVQRQVQEFSTDQGMLLIQDELARELGRAPTSAEVSRYVKQLNAKMRADPSIVTTVVTTNPATGRVDRSVTEEPTGVDPEALALSFSQAPSAERTEFRTGRYIEAIMAELGL